MATPLSLADLRTLQKTTGPLELSYAPPPTAAAPAGGSATPQPLQPLEAQHGREMRALVGRERDALVFTSPTGAPVSILERDVESIDARNHLAGAGYGFLLGLFTGAAVGAVIGASQSPCSTADSGCGGPPTRVGGALLDAIFGGVAGMGIGTFAGAAVGTRLRFQLRSDGPGSPSPDPP
jgi:hypothetical protein